MITVNFKRVKRDGYVFEDTYLKSSIAAFNELICCELAYGGELTDITETTVSIKTRVLDDIDTTVFSGDVEDMKPFIEVAMLALDVPINHEDAAEKVIAVTKGNPLHVKLMSGMLVGSGRTKIIITALFTEKLGFTTEAEITSLVTKLKGLSIKDITCLLSMLVIEGCSKDDVMALL